MRSPDGCACDTAGPTVFDRQTARADLRRYLDEGPDQTSRLLAGLIAERGAAGRTILDVGSGVGAIDLELLRLGAQRAVLVDASAEYLEAAAEAARSRGHSERVELIEGDFTRLAETTAAADIVVLDRAVCCYPDAERLIRLTAERARSLYGVVLPRDGWHVQFLIGLQNLAARLRRRRGRGYAHPNRLLESVAREAGLRPAGESRTWFWRVILFERVGRHIDGSTAAAC